MEDQIKHWSELPDDALLSTSETAAAARRSEKSLSRDRITGTGIPFVRIGRLISYRVGDVRAHVRAHIVMSTTEADRIGAAGNRPHKAA